MIYRNQLCQLAVFACTRPSGRVRIETGLPAVLAAEGGLALAPGLLAG